MKVTFFDTHKFEKEIFTEINRTYGFELDFLDVRLSPKTVSLAAGSEAICVFVNDQVDSSTMSSLKKMGVRHIALRSAGFNNVDLVAAKNNNIMVSRVPAYSPYAVAEFAAGLLLAVNRKIYRSYWRVRELNFSLDGLVGFDLHGKTVGVIGAGSIGKIFSLIMVAFGCRVLIYDVQKDPELANNPHVTYVGLEDLCQQSDIISLHIPLTPETFHIVDATRIAMMKPGVILINTGRGALIDSRALIDGLKKEKIGAAALDVYEEEESIFFQDLSGKILQDDVLARLLTFPNVVISSHQAFLTKEALESIARTTLQSIQEFAQTGSVGKEKVVNANI
jgi:D-lactate dehydrogenase